MRIAWSGVNPSDTKSRAGTRSPILPFPEIIPHSDGAGIVDAVGEGVPVARVGERVWVWNAAWGRPQGTAADYAVLPSAQAVALPDNVALEAGACPGEGQALLGRLIGRFGLRGYGLLIHQMTRITSSNRSSNQNHQAFSQPGSPPPGATEAGRPSGRPPISRIGALALDEV